MLEPLIALGAVANIFQFIDLTIKIFTHSSNIYHSANGTLIEYDDLNTVAADVSTLSTKLLGSLDLTSTSTNLTDDELALRNLCNGCIQVSQELTTALGRLSSQRQLGKFRSFRQALKSVWSKDVINELEKRVRMYKDELNIRIVVGLRAKVDVLAVQQSDGFASLDADTKAVIQSLINIDDQMQLSFAEQNVKLTNLHARTDSAVESYAEQQKNEHDKLHTRIADVSQQNDKLANEILDSQAMNKTAIDLSVEQNMAEHNRTREEMKRLKEEAERQVEVLTEEIRQLKIDLENSVKTIVSSIGTVSYREQQKLKDESNAKFNMWVAKELILEKLKAFLAMFRFNFATEMWNATIDSKTWKLLPYPRPSDGAPLGSSISNTDRMSVGGRSVAYTHVELGYPILAKNVPMVKMCLEMGANVNDPLAQSQNGESPLSMAVIAAYTIQNYDEVSEVLSSRRDYRKIIQLLIEHGADPWRPDTKGDNTWRLARLNSLQPYWRHGHRKNYSMHTTVHKLQTHLQAEMYDWSDWLITQLLQSEPDANLSRLLSMTDAVWNGDSHFVEGMLLEDPTLCRLADSYGVSALGTAVFRGDTIMANLLIENGASPNSPDPSGFSPLAIALYERKDMVAFLLQHGASATVSGPVLGLNPLEICVRQGELAICQSLLSQLDFQNSPDMTEDLLTKALFQAIWYDHDDLIRMLLDNGANPYRSIPQFFDTSIAKHISPYEFVEQKIASLATSIAAPETWYRMEIIFQEYDSRSSSIRRYGLIDP